jgi:segregation and condensation protein B
MPDQPQPHHSTLELTEEVSLDVLSQAFAKVMGRNAAQAQGPHPEEVETASTDEDAPRAEPQEDLPSEEEPSDEVTPLSLLEAMLFVGHPENEPLTAQHAASWMRGVEPEEIHELVRELNRRYESSGRPYHVVSEGAGYLLVLREEYHRLRNKFYGRIRAARLSQAAIEVLSLVAYNQPLAREDIERFRGVGSAAVLLQLVRRRLLRLERTDTKPRKTLYYTTPRLLNLLGLENLEDLPRAMDLDKR